MRFKYNITNFNAEIAGIDDLKLLAITLNVLKDMYNNNEMRFKSEEQAKTVQLTIEKKGDLLVILSTRKEKSLIFQLLIWMKKNKTTIIIVLFIILIKDIKI